VYKNENGQDSTTAHIEQINVKKKDTVYKDFPLGSSLKYGRIGMSVPEWNKNLALLAKNGVVKQLKELNFSDYAGYTSQQGIYNGNIYEGYIPYFNGEYSYQFVIRGIFVFPRMQNDTVIVYLRDHQPINDGLLVGIQIRLFLGEASLCRYQDINQIHEFQSGNMNYLAGDKLPKFKKPELERDGFMLRLKHLSDNDKQPMWKHEDNLSGNTNYRCLYELDDFYSEYSFSIQKMGTEVCDVETVYKGDKMYQVDKPIAIKNYEWDYSFLQQTIYSKKYSGLKVEDYMTDDEKKGITEKKKSKSETEDLINKALK